MRQEFQDQPQMTYNWVNPNSVEPMEIGKLIYPE